MKCFNEIETLRILLPLLGISDNSNLSQDDFCMEIPKHKILLIKISTTKTNSYHL